MKRWEKRRYFIREWEPEQSGPMKIGPLKFDAVFSLPACKIYGYEDDSEDDRDHEHIDSAMKRGRIFGRWFSTACMDGEWGSQPIGELIDIDKTEFEAAKKQGWKET